MRVAVVVIVVEHN